MNTAQLLKARYKVIASFPNMGEDYGFKVGDILTVGHSKKVRNGAEFVPCIGFFEEYPHLFKKLYWYQYRLQDELPQFVRINYPAHHKRTPASVVYKVSQWKDSWDGMQPYAESDRDEGRKDNFLSVDWHFYAKESQPATKEEYEQYTLLKESRL